ncbi:MAG: gliding motility-associated C-terminal domain-containing protein [Prevotellaceae bacterium]|jgi:hypothetical protein|nr:gliding motility-associated C-terminal domain-containing protein [Prevotellaceae bacterium]
MKKFLLSFFIVLVANSAAAQSIGYMAIPPIIGDGVIDDMWNPITPTAICVNMSETSGTYAGQWRALYDDTHLYFLIEVKDATPVNNQTAPADCYKGDGIEILISKSDGSEQKQLGFGYEPEKTTKAYEGSPTGGIAPGEWAADADWFYTRVTTETLGTGTHVYPPANYTGTLASNVTTPYSGYFLEVSIPFTVLNLTLSPSVSNQFKMELAVNQSNDGNNRVAQMLTYKNNNNHFNNSSNYTQTNSVPCTPLASFPTTTVCDGSDFSLTASGVAAPSDEWWRKEGNGAWAAVPGSNGLTTLDETGLSADTYQYTYISGAGGSCRATVTVTNCCYETMWFSYDSRGWDKPHEYIYLKDEMSDDELYVDYAKVGDDYVYQSNSRYHWNLIPTSDGSDVFFLQNVETGRFLSRSTNSYNNGGWTYYKLNLNATYVATDNLFKWRIDDAAKKIYSFADQNYFISSDNWNDYDYPPTGNQYNSGANDYRDGHLVCISDQPVRYSTMYTRRISKPLLRIGAPDWTDSDWIPKQGTDFVQTVKSDTILCSGSQLIISSQTPMITVNRRWYKLNDLNGVPELITATDEQLTIETPAAEKTVYYFFETDRLNSCGDVLGTLRSDTITITSLPNATGTDTQDECDSYTWIDGNTYYESNNTATYTYEGGCLATGCDSVVTLNLTIRKKTYSTDTQVAYDSFEWIDGNTYTQSNNTATYTYESGNAAGCDSVITLNLTIKIKLPELPNAIDLSTNAITENQIFAAGAGTELYIFNRMGTTVYKETATNAAAMKGWNGRYGNKAGKEVEPGTYYYVLIVGDETLKGVVEVIK